MAVYPKDENVAITTNALAEIAVRLGWLLLRSALQEVYPFGHTGTLGYSSASREHGKLQRVLKITELRGALEAVSDLPPGKRFNAIKETLPSLETEDEECITALKAGLRQSNVKGIWTKLCDHYAGMDSSTYYRALNVLWPKGWFRAMRIADPRNNCVR